MNQLRRSLLQRKKKRTLVIVTPKEAKSRIDILCSSARNLAKKIKKVKKERGFVTDYRDDFYSLREQMEKVKQCFKGPYDYKDASEEDAGGFKRSRQSDVNSEILVVVTPEEAKSRIDTLCSSAKNIAKKIKKDSGRGTDYRGDFNSLREEMEMVKQCFQCTDDDIYGIDDGAGGFQRPRSQKTTVRSRFRTTSHIQKDTDTEIIVQTLFKELEKVQIENNSIKSENSNQKQIILDKNKELEVLQQCGICMERERNTYIDPCGHTICMFCATEVMCRNRRCPVCREQIAKTGKLYIN